MAISKNIIITNPNNQLSSFGFIGLSDLVVEVTEVDLGGVVIDIEYIDYGCYVNGKSIYLGRSNYISGKATLDYGKIRRDYVGDFGVNNNAPMYLSLFVKGSSVSVNIVSEYGLTVFNYSLPEIIKYVVVRDEADKTKSIQDISLNVSSIINSTLELNEIKYKRQYKDALNEWMDIDTDFIIINSNSFSSILNHTLPYDVDKSYPTRILLSDKFDTLSVSYDTLPTSSIVMTWGKNGAGFGKGWQRGTVDMMGDFWKNDILQPTIYQKKPSDPVPEDMQEGDILIVVNDTEAFSSSYFPQEFGTGFVWSQLSTTDIDYYYWTFMQSTSNSIIESFKASTFKGTGYPGKIFDADSNWDNYFNIPLASAPGVVLLKFKGEIQFNSFTLWGNQRGDLGKNSPKSFAFFGSMDGERWDSLYDTVAFTDTNGTSASDTMNNSGNYYTYLMLVFRTNQNDNIASSGISNAISIHDLVFDVSGYKYV